MKNQLVVFLFGILKNRNKKYPIGYMTGQILSPVKGAWSLPVDRCNILPFKGLIFDRPPP